MRSFLFTILLLLGLGALNAVSACSCVVMRGDAPCSAVADSPLIFSGRVLSIESFGEKREGSTFEWQRRLVKFALLKAYRGTTSEQTVEIATGSGGGDCGYNFEVGRNYLVYTYGGDGKYLSTGICSRTRPLENAAEDVEYFDASATQKDLGSIFGFVHEYRPRRSTGDRQEPRGIADLTVTADGPTGVVRTRTDDEGRFEIKDLRPGEYLVRVTPPVGLEGSEGDRKVKVAARACARFDATFSKKNLLSGRVLNELGGPAGKLAIALVPVEEINKKPQNDVRYIDTNEDGVFAARTIAPGRYYLGFRIDWYSGRDSEYPATYYPGTGNLAEAAEITVGEDTVLENLVFQLRPKLKNRRVEGTILLPDGKPVPNPTVCAEEASGPPGSCLGTNLVVKSGKFSIDLPDGLTFRIRVYTVVNGTHKHAEPVDVPATGAVKSLKLVVSEPGGRCSRCVRN